MKLEKSIKEDLIDSIVWAPTDTEARCIGGEEYVEFWRGIKEIRMAALHELVTTENRS